MSTNKNSTTSSTTAKLTSCPVVTNTTLLAIIAVLTVVLLIMSILLLILLTRRRSEKSLNVSSEQQRSLTDAPKGMGNDEVALLREFVTNMQLSRSHVVPVLRHPKYECRDDVGRVDGIDDVGNNVTYLLLNSVIKRFE